MFLTVALSVTLTIIVSTVISTRITADAMRRFEKHLNEMCDINVEQCSKIKDITLASVTELARKTRLDK